ncbi:MAG TPA: acyl-CoA dehydrogenase C-terminal domain-containing protein [Steroidobacteraceae bacterium]|nr:acyl-CoA dehydrogenase C-terminal domain-containing protein [Steroidobacteraceae bacterium]
MYAYRPPLNEMHFVLHDLLNVEAELKAIGLKDVTRDMFDGILEAIGTFATEKVAPTNAPGDRFGVRLENGQVTTAPGFRDCYRQLGADGWIGMNIDERYGGQGLPYLAHIGLNEILLSANLAWRMCTGLAEGAMLAMELHGSEDIKNRFIPRIASGEWSATMCLTEPHAGSDLGLLRTRAVPQPDGSYRLTGNKIFISYGDHDMADNILHLVLARLPDAPVGSRGISMFAVPKFLPESNGKAAARNGVICTAVEEKMGIHASPTCALSFEDSVGWIVGPPNKGLHAMFTMMNHARVTVGVQGLALAECARQASVAYATERRQGRAPTTKAAQADRADLLIDHADVRRMLLTQKALVEAGRLLSYYTVLQMDRAERASDPAVRKEADEELAILTPIVKSVMTDASIEVTQIAVQIHGGHGYIRETGVEQLSRDARITSIYEGTNGIQAYDLLVRKLLPAGGASVARMAAKIRTDHATLELDEELAGWRALASEQLAEWERLTAELVTASQSDPNAAPAAATDYLNFAGYTLLACCWVDLAARARTHADRDFALAKRETARFFFDRVLPRTLSLAAAVRSGAASTMTITAEQMAT